MVRLSKSSGTAGLPEGVKETGRRVDFRPDEFTLVIETKGYRFAWSRAAPCPCAPINDQTEQTDPTCSLCSGTGWILFAPALAADASITGELDALQKKVATGCGVIMGLTSSITGKDNPYDQVLHRLDGTGQVTVRPENVLHYYDRLINLDVVMPYAELVKADGTSTLTPRYPIVDINNIRTIDTIYERDTNFELVLGEISWLTTPPAEDAMVSLHYLTYPHWRVVERPHMLRGTLRKFKNPKPALPLGDPTNLPIQALVKYDYLL